MKMTFAIAHMAEINGLVDSVSSSGSEALCVEIFAKHGHRTVRAAQQKERQG